MNIAVAIERLNPVGSGRERATFQLVRELMSRGHHITVLCGDAPAKLELNNGEIRRAKFLDFKHQPKIKPFARWATRILETGEFDTSLSVTTSTPAAVMQPRGGTYAALARAAGDMPRLASPKFVERVLGKLFSKKSQLLKLERDAFAHPMVQHIAASSRRAADELIADFDLEPNQISVIPPGSAIPVQSPDERTRARQQIRTAFDIDPRATVFLFAAHSPDLKGLAPLLHALKQMDKSREEVILNVVGNFPYHFQHLAAQLGVRDQVKAIGVTEQMADLFAASDVTVHPSFHDAGSLIVVESIACGNPVIASAKDGSSELVQPEGRPPCGVVIPDPHDVDALTSAMQAMLDDDQRASFVKATADLDASLHLPQHVDRLETLLSESAS